MEERTDVQTRVRRLDEDDPGHGGGGRCIDDADDDGVAAPKRSAPYPTPHTMSP